MSTVGLEGCRWRMSTGRVRSRSSLYRLDGWREGGLGQQRDNGGGWASVRER